MVNTSEKGRKIEVMAKEILEAEGYQVYKTIRSPYKGGANDVMGADLIAIKPGERIRVIQVTTYKVGITEKKREFAKWHWPGAHTSVEVWLWMARPQKGITRPEWEKHQYFSVRLRDHGWSHKAAEHIYPRDYNGTD